MKVDSGEVETSVVPLDYGPKVLMRLVVHWHNFAHLGARLGLLSNFAQNLPNLAPFFSLLNTFVQIRTFFIVQTRTFF